MKRKIWVTAGIAAALAFLIAFGAVGCVVSGFDLPLDSYAKVVLICGAASVFCAAAFSLKWGGAAVLCALAVASRAAFAAVPHFKPMLAIVMLTGIAFGPEAGFLCGAISGFASNFIFGQGPWTPWQMFAYGIGGLLAGLFAL